MFTIVTITGIRPDFIRMSEIFRRLDNDPEINHVLIHTGQHYDNLLSDVFFKELEIRKPDYNLEVGGEGKKHYHQTSEIAIKMIELFQDKNIKPDIILFLGDSNSVTVSMALKKEGYRIGHIEAGMRSGDKRMLEEINRTVCDHCSDFLFVYHEDYQKNLQRENINDNVYVVGNTIVEVCKPYAEKLKRAPKLSNYFIVDIHRPENFKYEHRMRNIVELVKVLQQVLCISARWINFPRTMKLIKHYQISLDGIEVIDLMSYREYLRAQYHAKFLLSDSGTAQEEPALLNTPVIVPRDFTERPQSVANNCSIMIDVNKELYYLKILYWLDYIATNKIKMDLSWLGDGKTSSKIVELLKEKL